MEGSPCQSAAASRQWQRDYVKKRHHHNQLEKENRLSCIHQPRFYFLPLPLRAGRLGAALGCCLVSCDGSAALLRSRLSSTLPAPCKV